MPNSIEQLLNDPTPKKPMENNKCVSKDAVNVNSNGNNAKTKNDSDQSGITNNTTQENKSEESTKMETKAASLGKNTACESNSTCVMEGKTGHVEMSDNAVVIGEVRIKQEPVDTVVEDAVTGIPPNAVLTEAQPSEVQDIRSMLPPMPIPSRGPGIRHRQVQYSPDNLTLANSHLPDNLHGCPVHNSPPLTKT